MAIIGKGPGPKKKDQPKSKIGGGVGRTVSAPGYAMGLIKNEKAMKEPTKTKTSGEGAKAVSVTTRAGVIGPKPTGSGAKVAAAPAKKKGPSAVGKAIAKTKSSIELAARRRVATSAYRGGGGSKRGTKSCAAYR
jgi:hypothetical protein